MQDISFRSRTPVAFILPLGILSFALLLFSFEFEAQTTFQHYLKFLPVCFSLVPIVYLIPRTSEIELNQFGIYIKNVSTYGYSSCRVSREEIDNVEYDQKTYQIELFLRDGRVIRFDSRWMIDRKSGKRYTGREVCRVVMNMAQSS